MTAPSTLAQGSPIQMSSTCCGGGDENSQSPHVYLALCGSPGYHFFALSFVDAAALLANDINRSVTSHLSCGHFEQKHLGL